MVRVGLLVGVLLGSAAAFTGCGSKPTYTSGGRTASYWAKVLKESDVEMRRKAALKIGPLMAIDETALPAAVGALKDVDTKVRLSAIRSLKIYSGAKASQAVPALRDVQENDKDREVREAAAKAVEALTGH
jgi:HEAT repeat protein